MPKTTAGGVNLNYTDTDGTGTPVLLLHAFPLHSGMWEPQVEALGERYRIIAPDLKGFGDSDAPEHPSSYSMDAYADELAALLDELSVERAVVVGLSMGGYIALAMTRRRPDAIAALVLADTRAEADPPEGVEKRTNQQNQVREQGTSGLIEALPNALLGGTTRAKKPDVVKTVTELMDNPAAGFIGALEAMKNRPDSTGQLASITLPTLVIVGEEDTLTPPEAARRLHEGIAGSRLAVLPEAGHISNLESPEAFTGALAEFLASI